LDRERVIEALRLLELMEEREAFSNKRKGGRSPLLYGY
jgi:hypothetical protein